MEKLGDVIENMMAERGMPAVCEQVHIMMADADKKLYEAALWYFGRIGREYQPVKEYREVADWLSDNKGKGLLLMGRHGRGKTILAKYLIPAVLLYYGKMVARYYPSTQLAAKIKEVLRNKIIVIDDIGVESVAVEYGNRRNLFDEIMDAVEQEGKLIILTTNLTGEELNAKYGAGVMDRLRACTQQIIFEGKSFRE